MFDFDNHEKDAEKLDFANENEDWHDEVDALRLICKQNGIDSLVERSRSGRGAFRRFKDKIRYYGIEQKWYDFQNNAYREFAMRWCRENNLRIEMDE